MSTRPAPASGLAPLASAAWIGRAAVVAAPLVLVASCSDAVAELALRPVVDVAVDGTVAALKRMGPMGYVVTKPVPCGCKHHEQ